MAEHEQTKRQRSEELEESRHKKRRQEANYDQLKAPDEGIADLLDEPSLDRHAALLANTHSDSQRASLVTHLQRSYGNNYVQRLLSSRVVQAKLTVTPPDDEYEREADRVADAVTQTPMPQVQCQEEEEEEEIQTKSSQVQRQEEEEEELQMKTSQVQRQEEEEEELQMKTSQVQRQEEEEEELQMKTSQVQRQEEEEEEEEIQPKAVSSQPLTVSENLEAQINTARGSGQPLNEPVRAYLEPHFKSDFSQVRIHTDAEADKLSQQLGARAFTTGGDIFFRSGEYNPETPSGQKLLAHELTHTQQQGASKRIAGWWPKGHRLITELALENVGGFNKRARNYLIGRSPDMDFKPDGFKTMSQGMRQSAKQIKEYRKLLASGDEADRAVAKFMYLENSLHVREREFLEDHGEAGEYKGPGATKNADVTRQLVIDAAVEWYSDPLESLSMLSDALHQAEDRGSHGEGNPFEGHDVRLGLHQEDWEIANWKPGWEPDDMESNTKGTALALGHAEKVLKDFKAIIKLPPGEEVALRGFKMWIKEKFKRKRRGKFGKWGINILVLKSSNPLTRLFGQTGKHIKTMEDVKSLVRATLVKDKATEAAYEKARGNSEQEEKVLNPVVSNAMQDPEQHRKFLEELERVFAKQKPPVPEAPWRKRR